VSDWGRARFGQPCRECGFDWDIDPATAMALVASLAERYRRLLVGHDGRERIPELSWPAVAYVAHVTDNLRIWAERLAAAAHGGPGTIVAYDQDALAAARRYDEPPVEGVLWSLGRATDTWRDAVLLAQRADVVLAHPERGPQHVDDVVRTNTHDTAHHAWDVQRIVGGRSAG
jgi:hypothetical protein